VTLWERIRAWWPLLVVVLVLYVGIRTAILVSEFLTIYAGGR